MPRTRRRFTGEFKTEAVRLLEESGRPLQAVAEELGVHPNQLRMWRNEHLAAGSAEALARQKAEAAELARLRRENKRLVSLPRWRGRGRKVGHAALAICA
jgi:transposase